MSRFESGEALGVADDVVLDALGEAAAEFARRQGLKCVGVGEDRDRLMERADQVLADGVIDAGLAADRRVDHGQQRRGDLNERKPAEDGGGGEARRIPDYAAAEGDERRVSVNGCAEDRVVDAVDRGDRLVVLAGRDGAFDHVLEAVRERRDEGAPMLGGKIGVVNDDDLLRLRQRPESPPDLAEHAGADGDVVPVSLEPNRNDLCLRRHRVGL